MNKFLVILIAFAFFSLGMYIYIVHSANNGTNGLGGFIMAIIYGGLFLICVIGVLSTSTIMLLPNASNSIRFIVAALFSVFAVYLILTSTFLPTI